jgi:hypothetical protein
MPFDPTLPVNNSPIVAAELRNQFNGLADRITTDAAGPVDSVAPLDSSTSAADTIDKINELLQRLKRL